MNSLRLIVAFLVVAAVAFAAEKRPITPQDLWAIKRVGSPSLSPDAKEVVFTVQEWSIEKNKSTTNLWLVAVAGGEPRRLTTAATSDSAPAWSPDGTRIAFLSKRGDDETNALYVLPRHGGEAEKILELPYALATPKWMPDGKSIVVQTKVIPELVGQWAKADLAAMKKEIKRRKDSKMTAKVTENRQYRYWDAWLTDNLASRLLLVDVTAKTFRDLTPKRDYLFSNAGDAAFDIAPDGKSIALVMNTTRPPFRDDNNADIYLVSTDGKGDPRNLTPEGKGSESAPVFAPDGKSLAFARTPTTTAGESRRVWRHDFATGKNRPLTAQHDWSFDEIKFSADGAHLWLTAEEKGLLPIFRLALDGSGPPIPMFKEGTATAIDVAGRTVVFLKESTHRPAELFTLNGDGSAKALTRFNEAFMAQLDLGKQESYWFKGAQGADIHGWIVFPPGYDADKKYPLVQLMHGGPHTMNRDAFSYRWNTQVFAATGAVVTWVNRHGSTGFGEKFAQSILNEWGDKPFEDIMRSTDFLLKKYPNLDPDRMAAAGASYGGYMAAWVLGHTDRFKAIIDHAGVNNSYAQYGSDVPHGFPKVMGGKPWDNLEGMQRQNPLFYAKNFKTPTLVIHGELDYRVPYYQGLELYGILQAMGVPSRLVVYPNENHWILTPQNAIHWHWEMQDWLARHIGVKPALEKPNFDGETR
ncbi:MAG: S9 family peptidase [Opitutaceae bacterium]|nr:S9 family peptidase [Opitutaceae bacterium]